MITMYNVPAYKQLTLKVLSYIKCVWRSCRSKAARVHTNMTQHGGL